MAAAAGVRCGARIAVGVVVAASSACAVACADSSGPSFFSTLAPSLSSKNPPPETGPPPPPQEAKEAKNSNPRTTASGFDPEALERGAKALRDINNSVHSKKVFELMRAQEETRLAEEAARKAEYQAMQSQQDIERQRVMYEEQRKLIQQQAQTKAQMARYEDELARKRMQGEHESQRVRNAELVKMQEESSLRQEQIRRQTEDQIQAQLRQTERERAELERETVRVKAMSEAEGRAREAKLSEDVNKRLLIERATLEKDKWLAAINTTFGHIGGGIKAILTDQDKLMVAVGGITALAAGVYTTREGARVIWGYVDRILGQPSLIRESSMGKYPWSRWSSNKVKAKASSDAWKSQNGGFGDVILHPNLSKRIQHLAASTANTKLHEAPFRNMLFYGPPGTGKTMAAKQLARESGLEYALMTGGDVAPLGSQAVTKIHEIFDWARKAKRGLLLFIDEADAFLCERNSTYMSEAQRSALNAILYRTGDQSRDIVLVLATNRPGDLDAAVADRIDEVLEFPLPGEEERYKLLNLYMDKYIVKAGSKKKKGWWGPSSWSQQEEIKVEGITEDLLRDAARKMEGFSGREIAKMMASVQGAVYGSKGCVLNADLFQEVVNYKVAEHYQRRQIATTSEAN